MNQTTDQVARLTTKKTNQLDISLTNQTINKC